MLNYTPSIENDNIHFPLRRQYGNSWLGYRIAGGFHRAFGVWYSAKGPLFRAHGPSYLLVIYILCLLWLVSLNVLWCSKHSLPNTYYCLYSLQYLLPLDLSFFIPSQQRWRGYSNAAVRGYWVGGCVRPYVHPSVCLSMRPSRFAFWRDTD